MLLFIKFMGDKLIWGCMVKKTIFIIGLILIFTTSLFAMININTGH
ncbi:MAG: hypothetical protein PWQ25_1985 [Deferribacteres bacterium]|jgi:hypothetical protein|nr:hypothetical protein [Deferribacteres bacterium]